MDKTELMAQHAACTEGETYTARILIGNAEGKRYHGRPRRRWYGNIQSVLKERTMKMWSRLIWFTIWTSCGL